MGWAEAVTASRHRSSNPAGTARTCRSPVPPTPWRGFPKPAICGTAQHSPEPQGRQCGRSCPSPLLVEGPLFREAILAKLFLAFKAPLRGEQQSSRSYLFACMPPILVARLEASRARHDRIHARCGYEGPNRAYRFVSLLEQQYSSRCSTLRRIPIPSRWRDFDGLLAGLPERCLQLFYWEKVK